MKRWKKILLWTAGSVVFLILVLAVALRIFLTEERLLAFAVPRLEKALDAEVEIGSIAVQFPFGLGLQGEDLSFQKETPEARVVFEADRFVLKSSLLSLLRRNPEIKTASVEDATLRYEPTGEKPTLTATGLSLELRATPIDRDRLDFEAGGEIPVLRAEGLGPDRTGRMTVQQVAVEARGVVDRKAQRLDLEWGRLNWGEALELGVSGTCDSLATARILNLRVVAERTSAARLLGEIEGSRLLLRDGEPPFQSDALPVTLAEGGGGLSLEVTVTGSASVPDRIAWNGAVALEELQVVSPKLDAPVRVSGHAVLERTGVTLESLAASVGSSGIEAKGTVTLTEDLRPDAVEATFSGSADLADFASAAAEAGLTAAGEIRFRGTARGPATAPREVEVRTEGTLRNGGFRHPKLAQPIENLSLDFVVRNPGDDVAIDNLTFRTGSTTWTGQASARSIVETPHLDFTLHGDRLVTDEFQPPPAEDGAAPGGEMAEGGTEPAPPPPMTAEGEVRVDEVVARKLQGTDLVAQVSWDRGHLAVRPITMNMAGGVVRSSYETDLLEQPKPRQQVTLSLDAVRVSNLLNSFASVGQAVQGELQLDTELSFLLGEKETLVQSLVGQGKLKATEGSIGGGDLTRALTRLTKGEVEKINYRSMHNSFQVADGRIATDDWFVSGRDADFLLKGALRLDGRLDYRVEITLSPAWTARNDFTKMLAGGEERAVIPAHIGGTLTKPAFSIDREYVARKLRESGKEQLLGLLGGDLEGLLSGRQDSGELKEKIEEGIGRLGDLLKKKKEEPKDE
jgi:hypothetical protein